MLLYINQNQNRFFLSPNVNTFRIYLTYIRPSSSLRKDGFSFLKRKANPNRHSDKVYIQAFFEGTYENYFKSLGLLLVLKQNPVTQNNYKKRIKICF